MAAPPYRDLLGHLCAEIERQEAQLGQQSNQIEELQQENARLLSELEELQRLSGSCPTLPPGSLPSSSQAPTQHASLSNSASGPASASAAGTGCGGPTDSAATPKTGDVCCQCRCHKAPGVGAQTCTTPSPVPSTPPSVAAAAAAAAAAAVAVSSSPHDESDAPSWTLSPTTLNSSSASHFWLNLQSNPSSPADPTAITGALDCALGAPAGASGGAGWGLSSPAVPSSGPAQASDPLHPGSSDMDPVRLVRTVLDCLDAAQQRRRRAAKLRRQLNGGQKGPASGPASHNGQAVNGSSRGGAAERRQQDQASTADGLPAAVVAEDEDENQTLEVDIRIVYRPLGHDAAPGSEAAQGSYMYILL